MPKCEKCGRRFDTERGLHIHQSQVHGPDEEVNEKKEWVGPVSVKPWILAGIVIVVGLGLLLVLGEAEVDPEEEEEDEFFSRNLTLIVEGENATEEEIVVGDDRADG